MARIVEGVDLDRVYTADDIVDMYRSGKLRSVTLQGYTARADADGTMRFIHWTQLDANRLTPGSFREQRKVRVADGVYAAADQDRRGFATPYNYEQFLKNKVKSDSPIIRRSPQQRVAAMMAKIIEHIRQHGFNGLPPEIVKSAVGDAWKDGEPITEEAVRRVVAHYLGTAEREAVAAQRNTNTRANRKARREQERLERAERKRWEAQRAKQAAEGFKGLL